VGGCFWDWGGGGGGGVGRGVWGLKGLGWGVWPLYSKDAAHRNPESLLE